MGTQWYKGQTPSVPLQRNIRVAIYGAIYYCT